MGIYGGVVSRARAVSLLLVSGLVALAACESSTGSGEPTISSVVVTPANPTLESFGATTTLSAEAREADGDPVSATFDWTSTNASVASVNASGQVTALSNGSTTVRATVQGGTVSGQTTVTVAQVAATVEITPAVGDILVDETFQLSATAEDAGGSAIAQPAFTWSSDDDDIATVDGSGLVTGTGRGVATITATSGSGSDDAEITVTVPDLVINEDTEMEGTLRVGDLTVDPGVTITVTGDLTIRAAGIVDLGGDLIGDCVAIDLEAEGDVTVNGMVHNGCSGDPADPDAPPVLRLATTASMLLDGADLESSGDIEITNDPTLTDDDFPIGGSPAASPPARQQSFNIVEIRNTGSRFVAPPAQDGDPGQDGGNGKNGRDFTLRAKGLGVTFGGNVLIEGQNGGHGGAGIHESDDHATASGGNGGEGGKIKVFVDGPLDFQNANNVVRSGSGGHGAPAVATGTPNADPPQAPGAEATGGNGGAPGLIDIRAAQGITGAARLTVEVGLSGNGGDATATGADGAHATAEREAQAGGEAEARAGEGADTPNRDFDSWGDVSGGDPTVQSVGGGSIDGGVGGKATATAGNGGNGEKPHKNGAEGGHITAFAGDGGDARLRGLMNELLGDGGAGGMAMLMKGNGGNGWNDCGDPKEPGGNGASGGLADGMDGEGGTGASDGAHGNVVEEDLANGGHAGRGDGPGTSGTKGGDSVESHGTVTPVGRVFQDGNPASGCPETQDVKTQVMPSSIGSGSLAPGTYPAKMRADEGQGDEVAEVDVLAEGNGNSIDAAKERFLSVAPAYYTIDLASAVGLAGNEIIERKSFQVCHPDPNTVGGEAGGPARITPAQPLNITVLSVTLAVIVTHQLTQVGACTEFDLPTGAAFVRLVGPEGVLIYLTLFILMSMVLV